MERAVLGLAYIPTHEKFYAIAINKAWQMLSDQGGMLLAQVLTAGQLRIANIRIDKWVNLLKENGIDATYQSSNFPPLMYLLKRRPIDLFLPASIQGSIKLIKTPNSPKDLPFLKIPGNVKPDQKPAA